MRVTSAGGDLVELESNSSRIEVRSLLANEPDAQLKPPSQPVVIEQDDYRLLIILGALLALALGALLAWLFMRWWQKRDRPEPAPPPPPPPWETAFAELHELERGRPSAIAEGRTEQWVDAVSDSIRAYLGRRYGFHGLESTTDEIAGQLNLATSLAVAPAEVIGFLGQCDLVKFAKASLADDASHTLIDDALGSGRSDPPRHREPGWRRLVTRAQRQGWAFAWLGAAAFAGLVDQPALPRIEISASDHRRTVTLRASLGSLAPARRPDGLVWPCLGTTVFEAEAPV